MSVDWLFILEVRHQECKTMNPFTIQCAASQIGSSTSESSAQCFQVANRIPRPHFRISLGLKTEVCHSFLHDDAPSIFCEASPRYIVRTAGWSTGGPSQIDVSIKTTIPKRGRLNPTSYAMQTSGGNPALATPISTPGLSLVKYSKPKERPHPPSHELTSNDGMDFEKSPQAPLSETKTPVVKLKLGRPRYPSLTFPHPCSWTLL